MSTNQEQPRGLILINGHAYPVQEVLNALERQAMTQLRIVGDALWIGNQRIRPLSKTSAEQAMSLTCFGSLAYCCDTSRDCNRRDEALQMLGMSAQEYRAIQQECHHRFLRFSDRQWPHDTVISPTPQSRHNPTTTSTTYDPQPDTSSRWRRQYSSDSLGRTQPAAPHSRTSTGPVDLSGLFDSDITERTHQSSPFGSSHSTMSSRSRRETKGFEPDEWRTSSSPTTRPGTTSTQRFCVYCGQDLREEAEFCSRCGRSQK